MKTEIVLLLLCFSLGARAQITVFTDDLENTSVPALPPNWWSAFAEVYTDAPISAPSSGYPGASGGICLVALNCNPPGETRSFQVDGIVTLGAAGLILSFGHRRTSTFTPAVTLEWSADGFTWQPLAYQSSVAGSVWTQYYTGLPSAAQNQPAISLRWTYTTNVQNTACHGFAGNYRIDDVKITAVSLPVELVAFTARPAASQQVELGWTTALEVNTETFAVERSSDVRQWTEIGQLPASGPQTYRFTDPLPPAGTVYYRLAIYDYDGTVQYSPVTSLRFPDSQWKLFPVPARDDLNVFPPDDYGGSDPELQWALYNTNRQVVISGSSTSPFVIHTAALPSGYYVLQIANGREQVVMPVIIE